MNLLEEKIKPIVGNFDDIKLEDKSVDFIIEFDVSFRNGPTVEIRGEDSDPRIFSVKFIDDKNNEVVHQS